MSNRNYIIKEMLLQGNKQDKINYKLSAMGTGKTFASISASLDLIAQGKKVLVLTPYKISRQEFISNDRLESKILWKDPKDKSKGIDFYNSPFVIEYPTQIVDELSKGLYKLAKEIKIKMEIDNYVSVDILNLFRLVVNKVLSTFDLIIYEEMDFLELQGNMVSKAVGLVIDERRFTKFDVLIAFMLMSAKNENVMTIGTSANRFPNLPKVEQNEASFLSGITEKFDNAVGYQDTGVKSNQNIRRLNIISIDNENFHMSMLRDQMIRGTEDKTIFFSAKKWNTTAKSAAKYRNGWVYGLSKNLDDRIYDDTNKTFSIGELEGYKRLVLTDKSDDNISNETFKESDVALINLSSSRAVSITDEYEDIVNSVAFSNEITSGVTQSWGRFRYTELDIYLVGVNLDKKKVLKDIEIIDPYLFEAIQDVSFNKINGTYAYQQVKNVLKISSKGKRISQTTKDKRQSIKDYLTVEPKGGFVAYKKWCEVEDVKPVGKTTFQKYKKEEG